MRFNGLDCLRAICALGIAIYHFCNISSISISANTILGKFQIYGVPIFFIISGFVLYSSYKAGFKKPKYWRNFALKRFFRIMPLFWLASLGSLLFARPDSIEVDRVLLNFTGLFGLLSPHNYIPIGGWSIGNEIFFYCLFPLLILVMEKFRSGQMYILSISTTFFILFSYQLMDATTPLNFQWRMYVNPLNQLMYFVSGIMMFKYYEQLKKIEMKYVWLLIVLALMFFGFIETSDDSIYLVTGFYRVFALVFSCLIVLFFVRFEINSENNWFVQLGKASYSLYIIHPIVFSTTMVVLKLVSFNEYKLVNISISLIITLFASLILYNTVEKYFMKLADRVILSD